MGANSVYFGAITLLCIFVGVVIDIPTPSTKASVLTSLHNNSKDVSGLKVALGFNVCVDMISRAVDVFGALNFQPAEAKNHDVLTGSTSLLETFQYHFNDGAAGERHLANDEAMVSLTFAAQEQSGTTEFIGGNAALMAQTFSKLGVATTLVGPVGHRGRELLNKDVAVEAPENAADEVHLILEYSASDNWNGTASRANRFIVTNDKLNAAMGGLELIASVNDKVRPDVLVVSGVHMLSGLDAQKQEDTLEQLVSVLESLRAVPRTKDAPKVHRPLVHLELAAIGSQELLDRISRVVLPLVDSVGSNEQELSDLLQAIGAFDEQAGIAAKVAESFTEEFSNKAVRDLKASPAVVALGLRAVLDKFPGLQRYHYHALPFHVIATAAPPKGSSAPTFAGTAQSAVAAGSAAASLQACDVDSPARLVGDDLDIKAPMKFPVSDPLSTPVLQVEEGSIWEGAVDFLDGWDFPVSVVTNKLQARIRSVYDSSRARITAEAPVAEWTWASSARGQVEFALAPVIACKEPVKTVGLGDAISAVGIATHATQ